MKHTAQGVFDLRFPTTFGDDAFFVSDSNRTVVDFLKTWPWAQAMGCLIIGPRGSGKTHLTHLMVTHTGGNREQRDPVSQGPCVILDDCDHGITPEREQDLFHLFNTLKAQKQTDPRAGLILTATGPLETWGLTLPDLSSRLKTLPCFTLDVPGDDLLGAVLLKELADQHMILPPSLAHYILTHGERSCAYMQKLVCTLNHLSLREKRKITLPLVKNAMAEMNT